MRYKQLGRQISALRLHLNTFCINQRHGRELGYLLEFNANHSTKSF